MNVPLHLGLAAANAGLVLLSYLIGHRGGPTLPILGVAVTMVAVIHSATRPALPRHTRALQIVLTVGSSMVAVLMFTVGRVLQPDAAALWIAGAAVCGLLLAGVALLGPRRRIAG